MDLTCNELYKLSTLQNTKKYTIPSSLSETLADFDIHQMSKLVETMINTTWKETEMHEIIPFFILISKSVIPITIQV